MGALRTTAHILVVACLYSPMLANCDCYACWELRGVRLALSSGEVLKGHIPWSKLWVEGQETQAPFPDLLVEPITVRSSRSLQLYEELHRSTYPHEGPVVATKEPVTVSLDSLNSATSEPDSVDGYKDAGLIPVVSRRTAERLIREPPLAYCEGESEGLADVLWISYNPQVNEKELTVLCERPWINLIGWSARLEANGIIKLLFPYD